MFKIKYETPEKTGWLRTEYYSPEDADQIAKQLVAGGRGDIIRTTVIEQAGHVYSQWQTNLIR